MAVRGVDDDDVDAGIDQQLGAMQAVLADAGRRGGAQAALLVLAGAGELVGLLDVLDRDQADAAIVGVDHQQLLDARRWCSSLLASSELTPSRTVTSFSWVISALTGVVWSVAKRTSRLVRMPASLPPCSTTPG